MRAPEESIALAAMTIGPAVFQAMMAEAERAAIRRRQAAAANARFQNATGRLVAARMVSFDNDRARAENAAHRTAAIRRALAAG